MDCVNTGPRLTGGCKVHVSVFIIASPKGTASTSGKSYRNELRWYEPQRDYLIKEYSSHPQATYPVHEIIEVIENVEMVDDSFWFRVSAANLSPAATSRLMEPVSLISRHNSCHCLWGPVNVPRADTMMDEKNMPPPPAPDDMDDDEMSQEDKVAIERAG